MESSCIWELIHSKSEVEGRPETVFQLYSRLDELSGGTCNKFCMLDYTYLRVQTLDMRTVGRVMPVAKWGFLITHCEIGITPNEFNHSFHWGRNGATK